MRPAFLTTVIAVSAVAASAALTGCGIANRADAGPAAATPSADASPAPLSAGQVGTLAEVPWGQIGPGWALAEYTAGSRQTAAPVTLYMIDPAGGRYQIYQWPATTDTWQLIDWSGDKTRVLLNDAEANPPALHQLTIATGQITTFTLPAAGAQVLGYTRPDGENILVAQDGVVRYSLTGVFQARLSTGPELAAAVSSPDGLTEVVNAGAGVELVSNAGGVIRFLPVPGTDATTGGCIPERWWNAADVLAACTPSGAIGPRLWLVPVSGAAPTALTPARAAAPDFGDEDAWQLPTGLYLQAEAGCGPPFIARQLADGTAQPVTVPGSSGANLVIATTSDSMLVQEFSECVPGSSLAWFRPATGGVQRVLTEQPDSTGVVSAIAFNGDGEQPS